MTILQFDGVSKTYYTKTQQTEAVKDLSFEVKKGQFAALIGPSGCGKTTILSLISGILAPTGGKITLSEGRVGYMLQQDKLFGWRTIWKNVLLGAEIEGKVTAERQEYARQLMQKYGLWEFRSHYPSQLSGGMRQRAALIRTLATDPSLLLLDEPFSALDFQTRLDVCDDVYDIIRKENKTALLVTHDISEAISMADVIMVLSARPARVKTIHTTNLHGAPLKRREHPSFAGQFEKLHRLLKEEK